MVVESVGNARNGPGSHENHLVFCMHPASLK